MYSTCVGPERYRETPEFRRAQQECLSGQYDFIAIIEPPLYVHHRPIREGYAAFAALLYHRNFQNHPQIAWYSSDTTTNLPEWMVQTCMVEQEDIVVWQEIESLKDGLRALKGFLETTPHERAAIVFSWRDRKKAQRILKRLGMESEAVALIPLHADLFSSIRVPDSAGLSRETHEHLLNAVQSGFHLDVRQSGINAFIHRIPTWRGLRRIAMLR